MTAVSDRNVSPNLASLPRSSSLLARSDSGGPNKELPRASSFARSQSFAHGRDLTLEDAKRVFDSNNHSMAISLRFAAAQVVIAAWLPNEPDTVAISIPRPPRMPENKLRNIPQPPNIVQVTSVGENPEPKSDDEEKDEIVEETPQPLLDERFGAFAITAPAAANVPKCELSDSSEAEQGSFLFSDRNGRRSTLSKVFAKSRSTKRNTANDSSSTIVQAEKENSGYQEHRRLLWCF